MEAYTPTPQGQRLAGKVALVTGGSSPTGFGAAIARVFAAQGAKVVIADVREPAPEALAAHGLAAFLPLNVTRADEWAQVVAEVERRFGRIDILVNNAGTSYKNKPNLEVTEDEYDRVMAVNVKSVFLSVAAVVPVMLKEGRGGSIINISSIGSTRPRPGLIWYNATKAAVSNATKSLAAEYGPHGIRTNAICPLLSGTGLFSQFTGMDDTPENRKKFLFNVPLGRLTEPLDIANATLFLASDEGKFVNGVNLEVDGGRGAS